MEPVTIIRIVLIAAVPAFLIFIYFSRRAQQRLDEKTVREGVPAIAYVVLAPPELYEKHDSNSREYIHVVFTTELNLPDLEQALTEWAERFRAYNPPHAPKENERLVGSVLRTEIPLTRPVRLPSAITDTSTGYMVSVVVSWNQLPERKLPNPPVLHLRVLFGSSAKRDGVYWDGNAVVVQPDQNALGPGNPAADSE